MWLSNPQKTSMKNPHPPDVRSDSYFKFGRTDTSPFGLGGLEGKGKTSTDGAKVFCGVLEVKTYCTVLTAVLFFFLKVAVEMSGWIWKTFPAKRGWIWRHFYMENVMCERCSCLYMIVYI